MLSIEIEAQNGDGVEMFCVTRDIEMPIILICRKMSGNTNDSQDCPRSHSTPSELKANKSDLSDNSYTLTSIEAHH